MLATQVEDMFGLHHGTLRSIVEGKTARIPHIDPWGLINVTYLVVQYLDEKAESLSSTDWRRAQRLKTTASKITELFNECSPIPVQRSQLDGPTDMIRPIRER